MSICKGVLKDVQKQASILNIKISENISEAIAQRTEQFILKLLENSGNICNEDKRKIITKEDIQKVVESKELNILLPLFD